jgi:hypothetical protein
LPTGSDNGDAWRWWLNHASPHRNRTANRKGEKHKAVRAIIKDLATVDEQSIRRDYFETPEGFDLLIKAMDESRRTRSDDERDLIARILRGALIDHEDEYSPEEYLNLLSDLTVQELKGVLFYCHLTGLLQ